MWLDEKMERKKLIDLLPEFIKQFKEFQEIMKAEDRQMNLIEKNVQRVLDNAFITDCDEYGIKKYEALLNITPVINDTLETRKSRVLLYWNTALPYTYRTLIRKMDMFCGKEEYSMTLDINNYELGVVIPLKNKKMLNEIEIMLQRIVPVNIKLELSLAYNTYNMLTIYTYNTLKEMSCETIRSEVLIND